MVIAVLAARSYFGRVPEMDRAPARGVAERGNETVDSASPERKGDGPPTSAQHPGTEARVPDRWHRSASPHTNPLRRAGDNVLVSNAGLRYGSGSREGHRLKHVLLHALDQPDRPGSHGVFDGGRDTALTVIDEAYRIARQRGPPTRVKKYGGRTVLTVDMGRRVGYVGGQAGKKQGYPPASHVRLVLEGVNVITAFPLIP
jgi:hypothetical protein